MTASEQTATLHLSPAALFAAHPGPALLLAEDRSVREANPAGLRIAERLAAGELPDLARMIADTSLRRVPHHLRVQTESASAGSGAIDFTLLPIEHPPCAALLLGRDCTLERNLTQALLSSRQMFKDLVDCSTDFAWEVDPEGKFRYVSPRGAFGYSAAELNGKPARDFLKAHAGPTPFETAIALDSVEATLRQKDGRLGNFEISSVPVFDQAGRCVSIRGVCRDVTIERAHAEELARTQKLLEHLSRSDDLTGLLNRRAFIAEVGKRLPHEARHRRDATLLFIDLDNFKPINDRYGHARGDEALKEFAHILVSTSRIGDLICRFGGDEFVLWLPDTGEAGARAKAQSLIGAMRGLDERFGAPGRPFALSVGIALVEPGESIERLLDRADAAMYCVKRAGKGAIAVAAAA